MDHSWSNKQFRKFVTAHHDVNGQHNTILDRLDHLQILRLLIGLRNIMATVKNLSQTHRVMKLQYIRWPECRSRDLYATSFTFWHTMNSTWTPSPGVFVSVVISLYEAHRSMNSQNDWHEFYLIFGFKKVEQHLCYSSVSSEVEL